MGRDVRIRYVKRLSGRTTRSALTMYGGIFGKRRAGIYPARRLSMVLPYIARADVGIRPYETVADSAL